MIAQEMLADANLKDIPRVRWLIQHTNFFFIHSILRINYFRGALIICELIISSFS